MTAATRLLLFTRLTNWIISWLEIMCATVNILTLSSYRPWIDFKFMGWAAKKQVKLARKNHK